MYGAMRQVNPRVETQDECDNANEEEVSDWMPPKSMLIYRWLNISRGLLGNIYMKLVMRF